MVVSLHLKRVCQMTTIRTSTKSFIPTTCLSFASIILLKPFMLKLKSGSTSKCNCGQLHSVKMSFIIDLILILNQGDTHYLCILFTHLSSLVCHVSFQLINTLIGEVAHVREPTFAC